MRRENLESSLKSELEDINYPPQTWVDSSSNQYDVVIIGAGMAGLTVAFALKRCGVSNICLFDQSNKDTEGPWATYARMPTLRSTKELVGPALDVPSLTFKAWYENQFGKEMWANLKKIPTLQWMQYLCWYRDTLQIPVQNKQTLTAIESKDNGLKLYINDKIITTSKVILATGRKGYGGSFLPIFVNHLPTQCYAHSSDDINFEALKEKKVGIIGAGASGFDAAATALEKGAAHVDILLRRPHLPFINKAASLCYAGFQEGYHNLNDNERCAFMLACYEEGIPPPVEALERVAKFCNFSVKRGINIQSVENISHEIRLDTNKGTLSYDFIILATGFEIDGHKQPELASFIDQILLWKDRDILKNTHFLRWFTCSPYLGPHFQFLEKNPGSAPFLKNIYCFNYAATLSHGLLSGDIPGIGIGATRLAQGIVSDLFTENWQQYSQRLYNYQTPELSKECFNFFS